MHAAVGALHKQDLPGDYHRKIAVNYDVVVTAAQTPAVARPLLIADQGCQSQKISC